MTNPNMRRFALGDTVILPDDAYVLLGRDTDDELLTGHIVEFRDTVSLLASRTGHDGPFYLVAFDHNDGLQFVFDESELRLP
jgi:hypothetical protein